MIGGQDRYSLSCWKAKAHSSVHSNLFNLFNKRKKGLHLSIEREIKTIQGGNHAGELLDLLGVPRRLHAVDSSNLVGADFNTSVGHHIA